MTNKKMLAMLVVAMALNTSAMADDSFVPSELKLSASCVARIAHAVAKECNADSKNDTSREHVCLPSESSVTSNAQEQASFELEYTVTDADVYAYIVDVSNKASCDFTIKSDN